MVRSRLALLAVASALLLGRPPAGASAQDAAKSPDLEPPATSAVKAKLEPAPPPPSDSTTKAASPTAGVNRQSILTLVTRANPMLWLLALCSIVTVGYTLERLIGLRRGRVIPRDFVHRFLERLSTGKLDRDRALELCRSNESPASRVFGHAVRYWGQPASSIRQAVDLDAAREVLDLRRNVRVLNGTATLAPLLGLLGTVLGMIQSFDALGGRVGSGKSEALAQGISLCSSPPPSAWGSRSSPSPPITTCSTASTSSSETSTTTPERSSTSSPPRPSGPPTAGSTTSGRSRGFIELSAM